MISVDKRTRQKLIFNLSRRRYPATIYEPTTELVATADDIMMAVTEGATPPPPLKSRKRSVEEAELEIDVDAPEPPSKKALRKAKKAKVSGVTTSTAAEKQSRNDSVKREDGSNNNDRSEYGIWIGNLAFSTTEDDLRRLLTSDTTNPVRSEQITRINLPRGPLKFGKPQNKGFAYVDFSDEKCLVTALGFSESMMSGRRVLIKNAKSFEGRPKQDSGNEKKHSNPPNNRLFVGNLDFATKVEDLEELFGVCGPITRTHMATFEDSGKSKGYAWIEFEELASAEKAMRGWVEANDAEQDSSSKSGNRGRIWVNNLQGRRLRMEYAEDKVVRYEKRYGKNARKAVPGEESRGRAEIQEVDVKEESAHRTSRPEKAKRFKPQGKYSEETVQKLTGAIVDSQGQRIVFE